MWQPPRDPRRRAERHRTDVVRCDLGDVVVVPSADVVPTGLTVEEGIRIILSAGTATPARLPSV